MRKTVISATLAVVGTLAAGGIASAAPTSKLPVADNPTLVEQVQGYKYRRNCIWVNGGWHYGKPGKYLVCRPHSPGRGWVWHSEGPRHGWYHSKRKVWHHNKW